VELSGANSRVPEDRKPAQLLQRARRPVRRWGAARSTDHAILLTSRSSATHNMQFASFPGTPITNKFGSKRKMGPDVPSTMTFEVGSTQTSLDHQTSTR